MSPETANLRVPSVDGRRTCVEPVRGHRAHDDPSAGSGAGGGGGTGDAVADLNTGFGASMTLDQIIADSVKGTLLGRLPTLDDVGNVDAFLVSDCAAAMMATFGNISAGRILDWLL